jgi:hypothetical protein
MRSVNVIALSMVAAGFFGGTALHARVGVAAAPSGSASGRASASSSAHASASASVRGEASAKRAPIAPDPAPLLSDAFFVLTLHFEKQQVSLEKVKRITTKAKTSVPRTFGRFAAELYVGPTLIERVRFDFPLIADDSRIGDAYIKGLSVSIDVKVPDSDRPTRLSIWDRATDRRWELPYPPHS